MLSPLTVKLAQSQFIGRTFFTSLPTSLESQNLCIVFCLQLVCLLFISYVAYAAVCFVLKRCVIKSLERLSIGISVNLLNFDPVSSPGGFAGIVF